MEVAELIEILKTFKPKQEVRVYKDFPYGVRRAVPASPHRVTDANTLDREERGLPRFILISSL
ncbi:hypothetical protein LCGC14_0393070 [marine sediment metagenome]|uniref:Uncharacterized protein n=1 Tax=marine sediment metagenome TaxID=412755 RepID=A0A0F9VL33_9ZZZZ